jgi:hypothetical protein
MRSVVLIHGLLQGNGRQESCEMLAMRDVSAASGPVVYSRCSVIDAPQDIPDGDYTVTFDGYIVPARKQSGLWIPDEATAASFGSAESGADSSRPSFSVGEAAEILSVLRNRVA